MLWCSATQILLYPNCSICCAIFMVLLYASDVVQPFLIGARSKAEVYLINNNRLIAYLVIKKLNTLGH